MSFQDALACFGLAENSLNTIEVILIAFAIMIYFTVTSSSLKVANIQNAIITFFKFIPILIIVIGGIILFGKANSNNEVAQD
jgi:amino acid transporter